MRFIPGLTAVLVTMLALPAAAATKSITLYLDGARVENELQAPRGYVEIPLPAAVKANSLRLAPRGGVEISRVEVVPVKADPKTEKEVIRLSERKEALEDRLKALAAREKIFLAAAKSQSGKAPRKSKSNPDPMATIKQGTDYAIAQLEAVYRAQRKTERELKSVEASLSALKKKENLDGTVARVWLNRRGGGVSASYLSTELAWTPRYDFRLIASDQVEVVLFVDLQSSARGATVAVVPASLVEGEGKKPLPVAGDGAVQVLSVRLPVDKIQFAPEPQPSLTFSVRNSTDMKLPAGEAACYRQGEYLGKSRFGGSLPGEAAEMAFGK